MLRAVLDVNVLVSAAIGRDGPPLRLLAAWRDGAFEVVAPPRLLDELDRVLVRRRIASRADDATLAELRAALASDAVNVDDPASARHVPGDPKDDYLVALALAGGAHVLVTGDGHLLDVDLGDGAPHVLTPSGFLALLERLGA